MDRRLFLKISGAGTTGMLGGCVTTQGDNPLTQIGGGNILQGLGTLLGPTPNNASRNRQGYEVNQPAYAAYARLYEEMQASQNPLEVQIPGTAEAHEARTAAALSFLDTLPDTLSDVQMAQVWMQIAPIIEPLNQPARQQTTQVTPNAGPRPIRIGSMMNRGQFTTQQQVGSVTVLPGQTMQAVLRGHCADKTLPAFVSGQPLTLRPADQFVAGDRWGQMQIALLDYFVANPQAVRLADQQFLLWALQGKDANGSPYYTQALMRRPDLLEVLERASPGGLAEMQRAQATEELTKHLQQILQRNLPPEVRQLMGNASLIQALSNPADAPRIIEQELMLMEQMSRSVPQETPRPEAAYSTLAPGVFAHSEGVGRLGAMVTMTNTSGQPFVFQPSRWVAETKTKHQRSMFTRAEMVRVWDHVSTAMDVIETVDSAARLANRMRRLGMGGPNMTVGNPTFDQFSKSVRRLHSNQFAGLISNPHARNLLVYVPIFGNIKSAFEVFDTSLSAPERVLAAIGAVPGAGNLARIAAGGGRGVAQIARWALENRSTRFLANASDRTEFLREMAGLSSLDLGNAQELWQSSFVTLSQLVPRPLQRA